MHCEFCDFAKLYKPRLRSADSIIAELRTLAEAVPAPRPVFFTDDNLALSARHFKMFLKALARERLGLSWRAFLRVDAIDEEASVLLRESGCRECLLGIESGDPGVLKNMKKQIDPDQALRAIGQLDKSGIGTQCTFVVGFPGECSASLERTAAFLSALPSGERAQAIHRYYLFPFQVVPLCPVAAPERRAQFALKGWGEKWSHSTMNSEEAAAAMRQIYCSVRGPTHMYLEFLPSEWPISVTRRVIENREALQKHRLANGERTGDMEQLMAAVRAADQ